MITRLIRLARRAAVPAALALASCSADKAPTAPGLPAGTVTINGSTVNVTIAATNAARDSGLMRVTNLGANSGMLFVFLFDQQRAFWMKDTPTPLSIVFLDANKKIVFMADMAPNDSILQYGGFNAPLMRYALEVNAGWFAAHGITTGMTASFTLPTGLVIEPDP